MNRDESGLPFGKIIAPWSTDQVDALNRFQRDSMFHPFTCAESP
jgi:hypothetical protein